MDLTIIIIMQAVYIKSTIIVLFFINVVYSGGIHSK